MTVYDGGRFIRESREAAGLNQTALASRIGVSQSLVSQWEHGKAVPPGDALRRLADALTVDLGELVGRQVGLWDDVEIAIVRSPGLRSHREQDALLAAYGALAGRDSLMFGRMLRAGDGVEGDGGDGPPVAT